MKVCALLIFFGTLQICTGEKFLSIVSMPSRSHHGVMEKILIELANKGHEVTFLSYFKLPKPHANIKEILLPDLYHELASKMSSSDQPKEKSNSMQMRNMSRWFFIFIESIIGPSHSEMLLSQTQIQDLIKSDEKYDFVIGETFLVDSMIAGFAHKFNASIISVGMANPYVGNPAPAAYIPDLFSGLDYRMNFCQRLENTIIGFLKEVAYRLVYLGKQDAIMRKNFGDDLPPIFDIIKNTSLYLINHHFSLAYPKPYLPNVVEIGGYHISPPKALPADLQKYMDDSKDGVILFSLGSHIKSADLPAEKKQAILKAFSRVKQNVIWKFEDETLKEVPKNVKITKWMPQSDILAHPNLKIFITHGGLHSTSEAVARGVPIIGVPVAADQPMNMRFTTNAGFGLSLDLDDLTEDILHEAIIEILNNLKYKENVKKGSELMLDRPLPAIDTALYWIEYVVRHKGAPHLRSAAADLKWYQLYLLDVLAVIFIALILVVGATYHGTKFVLKRILNLCKKKNVKVPKKKKEN